MPKCSNHCPFCNAERLSIPHDMDGRPADYEWTFVSSTEDSESTMARLFAEHNYR